MILKVISGFKDARVQFRRINFTLQKVVPFNSPTFCREINNRHRKFVATESGFRQKD